MERLTTKIESNNTTKYELKDMIPSVYGIHKLGQYEEAEDQGLLLRLPCKVGDTVYAFTPFCEVCEAPFLYEHICENCAKGDFITEAKFDYEMIPMVGKNVFLTKEEAEQALARMEKSHE